MKNTFKLFVTLFILAFALNVSFALPTYTLKSKDFANIAPNEIAWSVIIEHTNAEELQYAGGQYFWDFNTAASNGGTLTFYIAPDSSDLPGSMRPRNPTISGSQLRLAANSLPGAGNGVIMGQGVPIKVIRMRLKTSAAIFSAVNLNLLWRKGPTNPFTKINAYVNNLNTEITTPDTETIECEPEVCTPLPVELAAFTANVNRNNVVLNWSTSSETNNQGFDIERSLANTQDWTRLGNISGNGTTTDQKSYSYNDRVNTGTYNYRLKQIDLNGNFRYHYMTGEVIVGVPTAYNLSQNYPNPFNPSTKIDYDLPYDGRVSIVLYDISGREVANLVNEVKTAGYYSLSFNASNLSSGMYFYRINAEGSNNNFVQTKKMVLVK